MSLFDVAPVWACPRCQEPSHTGALCGECQARERDRREALVRVDHAWRLEVGEDVWAMAVQESGWAYGEGDWVPEDQRIGHVSGQARIAEDGPARADYHHLGWPASAAARAESYHRAWERRCWVELADGRLAPWRWQWGGMPEELAAVAVAEHFLFLPGPDEDWWTEDWVDENDGSLVGDLVGRTARPVVDVPVGACLRGEASGR